MNKILSIGAIVATAMVLGACNDEEELLFDKTAAERLNETQTVYSARLGASPNGWAMQYYPTYDTEAPYGTGYLMLCKFRNDGSVTVAMNNSATNNMYKEDTSAWEILTDNGPVLSFNTFNEVLHIFSQPEDIQSTSDSETGRGYEGDYEFIIVDAPQDASYMMLKGKKRSTYNLLTPIEDDINYEEYLTEVRNFQNKMFATDSPTFDVVYFGDSIYKLEDANDGIPNIYPYDGDRVMDETFNPFLITKRGGDFYLRFRDVYTLNDNETVQDFRYDVERDIFESVDNPAFYIDGDQPQRFFHQTMLPTSTTYWEFKRGGEMSEKMNTLVNDAYTELRANKPTRITLNDFRLKMENGNFSLGVRYNNNKDATYFYYKEEYDNSGVVLTYDDSEEPTPSTSLKQRSESLAKIIELMSQQFVITAADTKFNLNTIRFTSASDPELWFVLSFANKNTDNTNI